jgi:hypothetical protein
MSDRDARGDDVYQPANSDLGNGPDDLLDMENALDEPDLDATLDEGYSPPERPYVVNDYGTTQHEQELGESLESRLRRERPELIWDPDEDSEDFDDYNGEPTDPQVGDLRTGRLAEAAPANGRSGAHILALDMGIDGGAASAEEAAVHTIPDEAIE